MSTTRSYGWRRPATPHQGRRASLSAADVDALPTVVDLRGACPEVYDQGQLGSCTAQAVAGAVEYLQRRQHLARWTPSRLALYFAGRLALHQVAEDAGAVLADVVRAASEGVGPEVLWPYASNLFDAPPPDLYREAAGRAKLVNFEGLAHDLPTLLWELSCGYPIAFGAEVYEAFERVGSDGAVPLPARGDDAIGGHAMLIVGYDREAEVFIVRNSWGASWGADGYCRIPFAYLTDPSLCGELHATRALRVLG